MDETISIALELVPWIVLTVLVPVALGQILLLYFRDPAFKSWVHQNIQRSWEPFIPKYSLYYKGEYLGMVLDSEEEQALIGQYEKLQNK